VRDVVTIEAFALRHGLQLLENIGSLMIMESDNLKLVNVCNSLIKLWSPYTSILPDCF
jgi:hypothetical protein